MKRTLFIIELLLLSSFRCFADTRSTITPSGHTLYYTIAANQITIVATNSNRYYNYPDLNGDLVIPDSIYYPVNSIGQHAGYYPVRHIANFAFIGASGLTSVVIPNTIMDIGHAAFIYCSNLQSITFNDSLTSIPNSVCQYCPRLRNVTMGDAITSIGEFAFANCDSLETLIIPESVTNIGERAINAASLLEIHFRSVTPPNAYNYGASYPQYFPFNTQATLYIPCGSLVAYSAGFSYAASYVTFVEEYPYYLTSATADTTMGIVEVLIEPDCASPYAVIYGRSNTRYIFDHWSDNSTQNPRSISLASDSIIVGYFVSDTNIVHDTIFVDVHDTTYMDIFVHDTTYIDVYVHDTTFYPVYIHDTTFLNNYIHDTLFQTRYVYDTTYINNYIHDTVLVYVTAGDDTTFINNYVHDTLYIYRTLYDTTFIYTHIHDTTFLTQYIHDTAFVNHYIHDTLYLTQWMYEYIHDTIIQTVTQYVHDTTFVNNYIHDTTYLDRYIYEYLHDTIMQYINNYIHDTTYINNYIHDTAYLTQYVHDTAFIYQYIHDTIVSYVNHYIHDTTFVNNYIYDTIYLYRYIYDTIYIHDTIYLGEEGIEDISLLNAKIYQRNGQIVVEGAEGYPVYLYDVVGRVLATRRETMQEVLLDVPASGAYLVKIGDTPARRIVVRR